MDKKINKNKVATVYSEMDLKDAMKNKYGTIIIKGEIACKIYKNIDSNPKLRKLSNLTIIFGIFLWPLLLVGITGRILTATDFKSYLISAYTADELILKRK